MSGSTYRLMGGESQDLKQDVGQRVEVTGTMAGSMSTGAGGASTGATTSGTGTTGGSTTGGNTGTGSA